MDANCHSYLQCFSYVCHIYEPIWFYTGLHISDVFVWKFSFICYFMVYLFLSMVCGGRPYED